MGRHSAAADDETDDAAVVVTAPAAPGRHSRGDDRPEAADTDELGPIRDATAAAATPAAASSPAKPRPFGRPGSKPRVPSPPTRSAWPPRPRDAKSRVSGRATAIPPPPAPPVAEDAGTDRSAPLVDEVLDLAAVAPGVEASAPEDATVQIPVISAPIIDQAAPEALTEIIPPVTDAPYAPDEAPVGPDGGADVAPRLATDAGADASTAAEVAPATATSMPSEPAPSTGERTAQSSPGHASAADLSLVREHGDVRARCVAGLLLPFVVYGVVLLALGSFTTRTVLIWLAAPIVAAGVLVGLFLDLGHRRYGSAPRTD